MRAVNGTFDGKKVTLAEAVQISGPVEVVVVFPEPDPWDAIVRDKSPRPSLSALGDEVLADLKEGRNIYPVPGDPGAPGEAEIRKGANHARRKRKSA